MKLDRVQISNFRSIKYLEIKLDPACRVLVGINESGKSNILKALALLDGGNAPTKEDIRVPLRNEPKIAGDDSYVRFIFRFNKEEIDDIYKNVSQKILSKNKNEPIAQLNGKDLDLITFCSKRGNEGLYKVFISSAEKHAMCWSIDKGFGILSGWKKPTDACPADFLIKNKRSKEFLLANQTLIYEPDYREKIVNDEYIIPPEYLVDADIEDLDNLVIEEILKLVNEKKPKCLFWKYDEKYVLPSSVIINDFAADPDSCTPLRNMFVMAGYENSEDIQEAMSGATEEDTHPFANLLDAVADKTKEYFHGAWKEYKNVSFQLRQNGNKIDISVQEKNRFSFANRSDGFKRFISFLLMISLDVKKGLLENTLLLIDEPDLCLHPSGAKYLRNELIKISKTNYVIYSTHSIFMIDNDNIGRHAIVKKEEEKTSIKRAGISNFSSEEVIYNALNCSIFLTIKDKNIIFEGWRDKQLFRTAIIKIPDTHKQLKGAFKYIGNCHVNGVTHMRDITPLLELAQRRYFIVSDADTAAKKEQKKYEDENGDGLWKRYDEILQGATAITGEDFIELDIIKKILKKITSEYPELLIDDIKYEDTRGILFAIKEWLREKHLLKEYENIIKKLKDDIFDNLKPSHIKSEYYDLITELAEIINSEIPTSV